MGYALKGEGKGAIFPLRVEPQWEGQQGENGGLHPLNMYLHVHDLKVVVFIIQFLNPFLPENP